MRTKVDKPGFKKGQEVTFITTWDNKGTFAFQHGVVYSCGTKCMVLTDPTTGEEMGRHYAPVVATLELMTNMREGGFWSWSGTFEKLTDAEAVNTCLQLANAYIEWERSNIQRAIQNNIDQTGYVRVMQQNLAAIHPASVIKLPKPKQEN